VGGVLSYLLLLAPKNCGQDHCRAGGSAYVDRDPNMEDRREHAYSVRSSVADG
jgi:hypothetical protein